MPITPKTDEFIEGYIFSKIEKTIIQGFIDHDKTIRASVVVPKSWFGLTRALKRKDYTIPEHQVSKLRIDLKDAISGYNTDKRKYEYDINIFPDEQYIRFVFEGTYIEPVKEMTVKEIEKELGYKIKIVGDVKWAVFIMFGIVIVNMTKRF